MSAILNEVQRTLGGFYPDEGHDVQYRHFDQILADVASMGDKIVLCRSGKSRLIKERRVESVLAKGVRWESVPGKNRCTSARIAGGFNIFQNNNRFFEA